MSVRSATARGFTDLLDRLAHLIGVLAPRQVGGHDEAEQTCVLSDGKPSHLVSEVMSADPITVTPKASWPPHALTWSQHLSYWPAEFAGLSATPASTLLPPRPHDLMEH